jgi:hypothetical protein
MVYNCPHPNVTNIPEAIQIDTTSISCAFPNPGFTGYESKPWHPLSIPK